MPRPEICNGKITVSQAWVLSYNKPYFTYKRKTAAPARTSGFILLVFCTWHFNDCGISSVYKLINFVHAMCISEVIFFFLMIQLYILHMKHQPKSCFQSYTNITSSLLCKHSFWNLDNKELTFNASTTFASWKKKKEMFCVNRILPFKEIKCQK